MPCRLEQGRFWLGYDIGFESNAGIDKPYKISLILLVVSLGVNGIEHEALVFALEHNRELIVDALHLKGSPACILGDIPPVLFVEL